MKREGAMSGSCLWGRFLITTPPARIGDPMETALFNMARGGRAYPEQVRLQRVPERGDSL